MQFRLRVFKSFCKNVQTKTTPFVSGKNPIKMLSFDFLIKILKEKNVIVLKSREFTNITVL